MITTFDSGSAFGCERRGYFRYVMGLPEPMTGNQKLGTDLHAAVEHYLLTGQSPEERKLQDKDYEYDSEVAVLFYNGKAMVDMVRRRGVLHTELTLSGYTIADVPVKGFVDAVTKDGIVDWKTTKNVKKYGKKAEELLVDTQMLMYAQACHPSLARIKLAHGQFQTEGQGVVSFEEAEISKEALDTEINKVIIPKVERIKAVAKFSEAREAVGVNNGKCYKCAFRPQCRTIESESVMSFFSKNNKTTPQTEQEMISALEASLSILPPDAPASNPASASIPIPGYEVPVTVPERPSFTLAPAPPPVMDAPQPKRRGRPPKSQATEETKVQGIVFKSVTVSKGCTVNTGNFNSLRIDISVTAEGSDLEAVYEKVLAEVDARLNEEAEKFKAVSK